MAQQRNFWVPVLCGAVILTIGIGARQSFGIFQRPIAADLQVGRELWSFGNALSMLLMGALSPFAGNLADRFGTARIVAAGGALYVAGMVGMAMATEGVLLTLGNALTGIGMAAAGFGPIMGVIGRQTPMLHRSMALGVVTAGGSFGQFAVVPFASFLQERLGDWHATMLALAMVSIVMVPLAIGLREDRGAVATGPGALRTQSTAQALEEAFRNGSFWLLTFGFFVCGFHVAFVVFAAFLVVPLSWVSVLMFSAALGFLWLGTVPLTSGLIGYVFGPAYMSTLWGIVFFSHQLGSFLGGWGAGRLYDVRGDYDLMWWISIGLGLFAALINWPIREQPVERLVLGAARS